MSCQLGFCRSFGIKSNPNLILPIDLKNFNRQSYEKLNPELNTKLSNLVTGLSQSSVRKLDCDISLITLPVGDLGEVVTDFSKQFIYARSFYPDLLKSIRKNQRTLLISNPGTGKSIFQYYYLARVLNPSAFSALNQNLPPDSMNSCEPPEVVVRQVGLDKVQVFFIKEKVAHELKTASPWYVLSCFDPNTTLYFFEPDTEEIEPVIKTSVKSILATCSPNIKRYHEFRKNRAKTRYMPLFTKEELLTIGRHMREQPGFPSELTDLYSDDGIIIGYKEYGGIIRHVLPDDPETYKELEGLKNDAIEDLDWQQYMRNPKLENPRISHFIVTYKVTPPNFHEVSYEIVNQAMEERLEERLKKISLQDMIATLEFCDDRPHEKIVLSQCYVMYERVVAQLLGKGVNWILIKSGGKTNAGRMETPYCPKFGSLQNQEATFQDMKAGVLYYPRSKNFPFADMYYKEKINEHMAEDSLVEVQTSDGDTIKVPNVKLVAINTCFGTSPNSLRRSFNTFVSLKNILALPDCLKVDFLYCPHPKAADTATAVIPPNDNVPRTIIFDIFILKVPPSYGCNLSANSLIQ